MNKKVILMSLLTLGTCVSLYAMPQPHSGNRWAFWHAKPYLHKHAGTLYKVFSVTPDAPIDEIKKARKALLLRYHSDKNANTDEAQEKMAKINEAWEILSDPAKREQYDNNLINICMILELGVNEGLSIEKVRNKENAAKVERERKKLALISLVGCVCALVWYNLKYAKNRLSRKNMAQELLQDIDKVVKQCKIAKTVAEARDYCDTFKKNLIAQLATVSGALIEDRWDLPTGYHRKITTYYNGVAISSRLEPEVSTISLRMALQVQQSFALQKGTLSELERLIADFYRDLLKILDEQQANATLALWGSTFLATLAGAALTFGLDYLFSPRAL